MTMPSCSTVVGRQEAELADKFMQHVGKNHDPICLSDGIYVSRINNIALRDYVQLLTAYCSTYHPPNCLLCAQFIQVGKLVVHRGMIPLSELYRTCFPSKSYTSYSARSTVLRHLPLACVRIGNIECGTSSVLVMEYNSGMDFGVIQRYFSSQPSQASVQSMTKKELKRILTFA